jgi:hypothetical protein
VFVGIIPHTPATDTWTHQTIETEQSTMMSRRPVLVPAFCAAGILSGAIFLLSGCDSAESDSATVKPSASQQAAIDQANKATAEAHPKVPAKKRR